MEGFYYSDYGAQIIVKPDFFAEIANHQVPPFPDKYLGEYKVIERCKNRMYLLAEGSTSYTAGLFSQLDFVEGKICINGKKYEYFAFYFSAFDKKDLLEVCVPAEKDLSKYTFCVKHKLCSKYTREQLIEIAKQIKKKISS